MEAAGWILVAVVWVLGTIVLRAAYMQHMNTRHLPWSECWALVFWPLVVGWMVLTRGLP